MEHLAAWISSQIDDFLELEPDDGLVDDSDLGFGRGGGAVAKRSGGADAEGHNGHAENLVHLGRDGGADSCRPWLRPVHLPWAMVSFTDVFSLRAKTTSHSGAMEAHALFLFVQ